MRGDQDKEGGFYWRKEIISLVRRKRGRESGCLMCVGG